MVKEKSILEQLQTKYVDEAYNVAIAIKEDLNILDENLYIEDTNEENILVNNFLSIRFARAFKVAKNDYNEFKKEAEAFFGGDYGIAETNSDEEYNVFYFDVDSIIDINKTILENKKSLLQTKGTIDYLCGKYSYLI